MKLNLGCCDILLDGFVNVDLVEPSASDLVRAARTQGGVFQRVDLRERWPWSDSSIELIRAHDIIEHLPDKIQTMNEAWRVLQPGGLFDIAVPTTPGHGAWQDPTHVSFWNRNSFYYYEEGHNFRARFGGPYGIRARFRVTTEREFTLPGNETRLALTLEAVK